MKISLNVVNGVSYKLAKRTKHDKSFEILYILGYNKNDTFYSCEICTIHYHQI
jgi:hypothetical protein